MAEVQLDNVSKSFGDVAAVRDLSLTIGDGEFVVLLGPTGAGKTTTLRLVAGLERPDIGSVQIGGADVTADDPSLRDVSFVFQQYSLYPHYSVYENMAFPLKAPGRNLSPAEIDGRVREIATMLRIEDKLQNKATQLSGGEMQRVSIGRALVRQPTIFLMDEPLSSLDAKLRDGLRVELKRIQRDLGATILYVTHDQLEAMTLADRIGILDEGRLVQVGDPREVYERPANIYAARRLGSPQINLLPPGLLPISEGPAGTRQVGVRPEDIRLHAAGGVEAEILTVEHLGVETVVLMQVADCHIHSLQGGAEPVVEGARVRIDARPAACLFFDANGDRLAADDEADREAIYGT